MCTYITFAFHKDAAGTKGFSDLVEVQLQVCIVSAVSPTQNLVSGKLCGFSVPPFFSLLAHACACVGA